MEIVLKPDVQVEVSKITYFYERVRTNLFRVLTYFDRYKPGADFTRLDHQDILDDLSRIKTELRIIQASLGSSEVEEDWVDWIDKQVTSLLNSCEKTGRDHHDLLRRIFKVGRLYEVIPTLDLMVISNVENLQQKSQKKSQKK